MYSIKKCSDHNLLNSLRDHMFEYYLWSNQPCKFCQASKSFHGHRTPSAKTGMVPGKLEQIGHLQNYFSR